MVVHTLKQPTSDKQQRLLFSDLQEHNAFFDALVDMFPSKLYIPGNSGDDYNPKYFKGQHKENKEARRAQKKASKRAKFDPSLSLTTTKEKSQLDSQKFNQNTASTSTSGSGRSSNGNKKFLPQKGDTDTPKSKKSQDITQENQNDDKDNIKNNIVDHKSRIEALRAKLHAKIAEKGGSRPTDPTVVSKRAARRAEKQRRKEEAIKRKQQQTSGGAQTQVNGKSHGTAYTSLGSSAAGRTSADRAQDLAQIDFGRITGLNPSTPNYKNNKALSNVTKSKNLEKILADAEEKKQKLEALKRSSNQEDKEKLAKIQWSDALKEASGERVKDDPTKIKNKLKRKAAKKAKSQKAWKSRVDQLQDKQQERQKIRSHNLDKRKLGGAAGSNLSKKRISEEGDTAKKGKLRAGFEGKKKGFLNDVKDQ